MAKARSLAGNHSVTALMPAGKLPASPIPSPNRAAANWVYNIAPKDGTVLATADQSLSLQQAAGDKRINFDTTKFIYIGNPNVENNTTAAWHTSGIKTLDDAKRREVTVGATGGSTSSCDAMKARRS